MFIDKNLDVSQRRNIVKPTSDIFARYLLTRSRHEHLTKSFINAVLLDSGRPPVSRIIIRSPFNLAESMNAKESVMDVEAVDSDGRTFDIEIQNSVPKSFFLRLSYYQAKMFSSQLKESELYSRLKPCVSIALLEENLYSDIIKPHHFSALVDKEERSRPFMCPENISEYHILELSRFEINAGAEYTVDSAGRKRALHPELFKWLRFFKDGARSNFMNYYNETDTAIKQSKEAYEKFIEEDRLWIAQLHREMALHDEAQRLYDSRMDGFEKGRSDGIRQGLADGIQQGLQQGVLETAKAMKKNGIAEKIITLCTGLTAEQIKKL